MAGAFSMAGRGEVASLSELAIGMREIMWLLT